LHKILINNLTQEQLVMLA